MSREMKLAQANYLFSILDAIMPDREKDIHVLPESDVINHVPDMSCECMPYHDEKNRKEMISGEANKRVIIHNKIKDVLQ